MKGLASCNWHPLAIIVYSHFVTFESGRALNEKLANRFSRWLVASNDSKCALDQYPINTVLRFAARALADAARGSNPRLVLPAAHIIVYQNGIFPTVSGNK